MLHGAVGLQTVCFLKCFAVSQMYQNVVVVKIQIILLHTESFVESMFDINYKKYIIFFAILGKTTS